MTNLLPAPYSMGKNCKCSPKTRNKTEMSASISLIQHSTVVLEVPPTAMRPEEEIKGIQIKKEKVKLFICRWHDIIHRDPQRFHQETTRTGKFSKVAGYKINIQKSVAYSYVHNKLTERELKKTIPFTIASKRIKYLGINLTKNVKDLHLENYKTLKKEIEEDTNT